MIILNKLTNIKSGIKVIGWDDGPFRINEDRKTVLIGAITRGGDYLEGIEKTDILVDGKDATFKIIEATRKSKHFEQLRAILLDGITYGGFNVVDIKELNCETKLPVIVVSRNKTDFEALKTALKNLPDFESRWKIIEKAGKQERPEGLSLYLQESGIRLSKVKELVELTATHSNIPEPLRLANLISSKMR